MESTVSNSRTEDQNYVELPFGNTMFRITGDQGVLEDIYEQYRPATPVETVADMPKRIVGAVAGYLGNVASNIKLEARIVVFDAIHNTNYRQLRAEMIEQKRREQFLHSIGLIAVSK